MTTELVARLGLDDREFKRKVADAARKADEIFSDRALHKAQRFGAAAKGVGLGLSVAFGAAALALREYAKESSLAQRQMEALGEAGRRSVRSIGREVSMLVRDIEALGLTGRLGAAGDAITSALRWRDSWLNPARNEVRDLLEQNDRMDMADKRRELYGSLDAGLLGEGNSPAERRAIAERRALDENRRRLREIAGADILTNDQRAELVVRSNALRDESLRRVDRSGFGAMDPEIARLRYEQQRLGVIAATSTDDGRKLDAARQLAEVALQLKNLVARRDAMDNLGLSDSQVRSRITEAKDENRLDYVRSMIDIEEQKKLREEQKAQTRRGVRDQLVANRIEALGAGGNTAEARRLALGLNYTQELERIRADRSLSDEQRAALLGSTRSLFEAQFAALGSGFQQRLLGAGSGSLAGQVFVGAGPQSIDVQKSMDRTLKDIERNTSAMVAGAGEAGSTWR